jgi:hypothetical protein
MEWRMDGPARTWQEQWKTVMRGYMAIGRCYSGQHLDSPPEQVFYDFCKTCSQLPGFLEDDQTLAPTVREAVRPFVAQSFCITLTDLIAHPRYIGETAVHSVTEDNPPRTLLRIEWNNPDGTTDSDDALDVAAGAIGEWRRFLSRHNLNALGRT